MKISKPVAELRAALSESLLRGIAGEAAARGFVPFVPFVLVPLGAKWVIIQSGAGRGPTPPQAGYSGWG